MNAAPDRNGAERPPLPTGTVTFLFTDIEGSTRQWEIHAPNMQAALREHDRVLRSAIEQHAGHVFKTIGDAFCAAFARPDDAVVAACEAQRALASGATPNVRMALHSGTTDERDGDYFGPPLNRVARLLASAHGGQIVVSNATTELVRDLLPADHSLRDLGLHRFKDLGRPESVSQLVAPGLRDDFPRLRSLPDAGHNLPLQLTSFVGRTTELDDIARLLRTHRLITLLGAGGVGKTRTAVAAGARVLPFFANGVWLAELAPLTDAASLAAAVATAIGSDLPLSGEPEEALATLLAQKTMLIVLDNCEHLIEGASRVAAAILRSCPHVTLLATSRQPLGVNGEIAYRLPTLSVPSAKTSEHMKVEEALRYDAIALFVERASAVDASFTLEPKNVRTVSDISRRLDGIALALELAAARIRIFRPEQLRDRLDERFRLLTRGKRDALPRQQTLRALIDWSYDLLDERERALFRSVAIFSDGFTLEAATQIGASPECDDFDVVDTLASLVDKSLVVADDDGQSMRYRLLESTGAYALEKLRESGEAEAVAERHLNYFERATAAANRVYEGSGSDASLQRIAVDFDNIRTALRWAEAGGDVRAGAALAVHTSALWRRFGASAEGIARAERLATMLDPQELGLRAALWSAVSSLAYTTARTVHAQDAAHHAVAYAREVRDTGLLIDALLHSARATMFLGDFDAGEADIEEAATLDRDRAVSFRRAEVIKARGLLYCWRGDYPLGADAFRELRTLYRALANDEGELSAASTVAECEHACGRTDVAIELIREISPRLPLLGNTLHANALSNLAGYFAHIDAHAEAKRAALESVALLAENDPDSPTLPYPIEHFALTLALQGYAAEAARLYGYTDAALERNGMRRMYTESRSRERLVAALHERLAPGALAQELERGAALRCSDVVASVLAHAPA